MSALAIVVLVMAVVAGLLSAVAFWTSEDRRGQWLVFAYFALSMAGFIAARCMP
jgi:ABC-type spermidine/putrescine transport system permease subunit II